MKEYVDTMDKAIAWAGRCALNTIRHLTDPFRKNGEYYLNEDAQGLIEAGRAIYKHNSGGHDIIKNINSVLVYYDEESGLWKTENKESIINACANLVLHAVPVMPQVWKYTW